MPIPAPRAGIDSFGSSAMGTGTANSSGTRSNAPANGAVSMPGGNGRGGSSFGGGMPSGGSASGTPWFIVAGLLLAVGAYWHVNIGGKRTEAAVIRAWAQSPAVKAAIRGSIQSAPGARKGVYAANKNKILAAYKTAAQSVPGGASFAAQPVPFDVTDPLETALIKRPNQATQVLMNAATRTESGALPFAPQLVTDPDLFKCVEYGLFGVGILLAGVGGFLVIPKRRTFSPTTVVTPAQPAAAPQPAPVAATPAPAQTTPAMPIPAPRTGVPTITPPTLTTPFPPPPDTTTPTITGPTRGSIAANVAAVSSSSAEVARLVRRLEELESLAEKMRDERDETRKELTWTQGALDDFKQRVSDATTMAAASAAQSAGASEQRAAQAEAKVTEAVEHINEALHRAMEAEQSVMQAKERAQTADERAKHAEVRSQEMQYQLSRAMERLADLERLAATARLGGLPASPMTAGPIIPPALPSPDAARYPNGVQQAGGAQPHNPTVNGAAPNPMDAMLAAAAARPTPPPPTAVMISSPAVPVMEPTVAPATPVVAPPAVEETTTAKVEIPTPAEEAPTSKRIPPPRLTATKMSDIQAGLKLASTIRSRTQKATANTEE